MPIIFAQALMLFPIILSSFDATRGLAAALSNYTGFWYNFIFGLLVVAFTYFYTAVTVNPTMMAEEMKKNGGFIPGVKPGKKTVEYLDTIMSRITLPGSIFLTPETWPAFAPELPANTLYNVIYGEPKQGGNHKILVFRGISNGLEMELTFKRQGNKWLLTKLSE